MKQQSQTRYPITKLFSSEQHREFLEERMDPDYGLLDKLLAEETVGWREIDDVKSKSSFLQRNQQLLDYILTKEQWDGLTAALRDADQVHIVNYITADGGKD